MRGVRLHMDKSQTYRQSVKELIELLASKEQQMQYQDSLSVGDPAAELVCMWFDDTYHPDTELFNSAFTHDEAAILASFNTIYQDNSVNLPDTLEEFHRTSEWSEIMSEAKYVLGAIQWQLL